MNIFQILGQPISKSPHIGQSSQQQEFRSRLRRKAENLLQKQAKGKFLDNTQKRIVARYQRQQLQAIGGAA